MKTFFEPQEGAMDRPILAHVARHVIVDPEIYREAAEDESDDKTYWTDAKYCTDHTGDRLDQNAGWDKKI